MDPYGYHKFATDANGKKTRGTHVPQSDTDNKGMLQHYTWEEVRLLDLGFNIQIFQEQR